MICHLCPRRCGAERTETAGGGVCGMPAAPVVARAGLHHWEEPVISGTRGSGAVFFSGCNLRCGFCQNHSISAEGVGKRITTARLREIFEELIAQGAHNINLVTPTHFVPWILPALEPPLPVPVVYNCGGYESLGTLRTLEGRVQIYLPDLKYAMEEPARALSAAPDYFPVAAAAIREMVRQTGTVCDRKWSPAPRRGHPPPRPAGAAGKYAPLHRLGQPDVPSRRGALFAHEPVHAPARRAGGARAAT